MSVIPSGYSELSMEFDIPGDAGPAIVVLGLQPPGATSIDDQADDLETILNTTPGLKTSLASAVEISRFVLRFTSSPGVTEIVERTLGYPGLQAGATSPPQVALLVQKSTGIAGRKNRGRMYVPGLVDTGVEDDGRLTSVYQGQWQTGITAFGNSLSTAGYLPVILHTSAADTPTPVQQFIVASKVATQRRRLR